MSDERSPLSGLRVLDLSRVLAGPYAGRMLRDLGADVVKIEPPEGDVTRVFGKSVAGLSGYYTQQNAGKRDLCIDLRSAGGPALVRELAAVADVLIENFRPGVMAQYELDWSRLRERNPRLVMLSISGFGQAGPESRRPAYAAVAHAESGVVQRQSELDGGRPMDLRISIADTNAALHGLVAVLAALHLRERTGRGQHIDISMLQTMIATDDYVHLALDDVESRAGVVVNGIWQTAFGPIAIAGDFRWVWQKLKETFALEDPAPKGSPIPVKAELRGAAVKRFFESFQDRDELIAALDKAGLPFGEVKDTQRALHAPSLQARGAIAEVDDRAGGLRKVVQSPYRYSDADSRVRGPAPYRGEHNREVLRDWLAFDAARVRALEAEGVLLAETPPA